MCVNNLSKVALDSAAAGIEPATSSHLTTDVLSLGVRVVQTTTESLEFFELRVCTKILSKLCSFTHHILKFLQETLKLYTNVKFCFTPDPLPGLCPWAPLGDFSFPDVMVRSPFRKSLITSSGSPPM